MNGIYKVSKEFLGKIRRSLMQQILYLEARNALIYKNFQQ